MSSAGGRFLPSLGRTARGVIWAFLFAVLAAGAAGLIAQASHAPGSPARAELTSVGDTILNARLDAANAQLQAISDDVDQLAEHAKAALGEITNADPTALQAALSEGDATASTIDGATAVLLASLHDLPGGEPNALLAYSGATLVRRAAVLTALDAAKSLNAQWLQVTRRAGEVASVTARMAEHDQIVLGAAAQGRSHEYATAVTTLNDAILAVADVKTQRDKLIADPSPTVLDQWIERNRDYDLALQALYQALVDSGGIVTADVVAANRAQQEALGRLPEDRRAIIVIVAEVARGGLTQAVLAIEDARGRMDDALAGAGPQPTGSDSPDTSDEPSGSQGPGGSGVPLP